MFSSFFEKQNQNSSLLLLSQGPQELLEDDLEFEPLEEKYISQSQVNNLNQKIDQTKLRINRIKQEQVKINKQIVASQIKNEQQNQIKMEIEKERAILNQVKNENMIFIQRQKSKNLELTSNLKTSINNIKYQIQEDKKSIVQQIKNDQADIRKLKQQQTMELIQKQKTLRSLVSSQSNQDHQQLQISQKKLLSQNLQSQHSQNEKELARLLIIEQQQLEKSIQIKKRKMQIDAELLGIL